MSDPKQIEGSTGAFHRFKLRMKLLRVLEFEDVLFRHNSAVFLPDREDIGESGTTSQEKITGLNVAKTLLLAANKYPDEKLLLAGHADTSGSEGINVTISKERAESVLHVIENNKHDWVAVVEERHRKEDIQHILRWTGNDPGPVDGIIGPNTIKAIKAFQDEVGIASDGIVGPITWGQFFERYQQEIADLMANVDGGVAALGKRKAINYLLPGGAKAVGCGETWPLDNVTNSNYRSQINRRVEALFFAEKEIPKPFNCGPSACMKKACPLYKRDEYRRVYIEPDGRFISKEKYEVVKIEILVDAPDNKMIMNDPEHKCLMTAKVTYKKSTAADALDAPPDIVIFSFSDPGNNNTEKPKSYNYSGTKHLGKKADATAIYWEAHAEHAASSDDRFSSTAKVATNILVKDTSMEAKVYFKPSGVGGNNYKIVAKVCKADGKTEHFSASSSAYEIWRKVSFDNIYEMKGLTHVSKNAATATISPVFNPAFVVYVAGTRKELTANQSVKYIGLWKDSGTPQKSWAAIQAKIAAETPTAEEIEAATSLGLSAKKKAKRKAARTAIIAKAQLWVNRIDFLFSVDMQKWITDAGLPVNSMIAIEHYHPKYSHAGGDYATNEWKLGGSSVPSWLRVGAYQKTGGGHYYTNLNPDGLWQNWGGLSHKNGRVSVPKGNSASITKHVVRHEAGHATKYFFKRDAFGPSLDHSVSNAGIMYYTHSEGTTFTSREKKILRGIVP